jgi:AraC-like DNA-binding protein
MDQFIVVATPVYITLFWAIVFLSGGIIRNRAKFMLGIFMVIATMLYTCHAIFFLGYVDIYFTLDALYLFTSLSVYPLYYWYVKLLTSETEIKVYNLRLFIPAIVFAVLLEFMHIIASPEEQMQYYNEILIHNNWSYFMIPGNAGWLARVFLISRMVFAVQVVYCLILGIRLASRHNLRIEDFYSNIENRKLVWVKLLNFFFLVFSMTSIVFNFLGRGVFTTGDSALIIPSAIFSCLLFVTGLLGSRQNDSIREMRVEPDMSLLSDTLSDKSRALLKEKLTELMVKDRIYLVPDLKITTLSKFLNTNRTYISNLINEETGGNFNNYVNRFRVEHAINMMGQKGASLLVMDYIAEESGFGSSSSFIRAFKNLKGTTPGKYMESIRSSETSK